MSEINRIDETRIPIFIGTEITPADLNMLYPYLAAKLPDEAVEETKGALTKKGYDTTGYGYQYVINRFNEVVGPSHFKIMDGVVAQGPGGFGMEVTMNITIQIGNFRDGQFVPISERSCYGGHQSKTLADALKGAYTNGLKKTAGLYGVGRHAYEGSIDDDSRSPEGDAGGSKRGTSGSGGKSGGNAGGSGGSSGGAGNPKANGAGSGTNPNPGSRPAGLPGGPSTPAKPADASSAPAGGTSTSAPVKTFKAKGAPTEEKAAEDRGTIKKGTPYVLVTAVDEGGKECKVVAFADTAMAKLRTASAGDSISGGFKPVGPSVYELTAA